MSRPFGVMVLSPPGLPQPSLPLAASRGGAHGFLDLEYIADPDTAARAIREVTQASRREVGIKLDGDAIDVFDALLPTLPDQVQWILLTAGEPDTLPRRVTEIHRHGRVVLLEARSLRDARAAERLGVEGVVAKGNEAGGRVADETTFILLQRLVGAVGLPVWAQGGISLHSAAACYAAGAAGVVLDDQFLLMPESPVPDGIRARISAMDGSETVCLGTHLGETYRLYSRPGWPGVEELRALERRLAADDDRAASVIRGDWRRAIRERVGWTSPERDVLLVGQDATFARSLADRFHSVGGLIDGLRTAARAHCEAASKLRPFDEGAPLARSHRTRYPIVQGPMTRVSDTAEFAGRVADGGALPFLALALMRGPDVKRLLEDTHRRLGDAPWGVGILGFVPPEFRQEQFDTIRACRPPFALIAGGRPDQARVLERDGIPTYLHVPSPALLELFIRDGARRFVFEGRECGGHVGPRSSFVLWSQMIDVLLETLARDSDPDAYHVLFAAGIHDALSAAMVAAMAAPLAERGARVGVLLGTGYLFTEEAVTSGAVLKRFQDEALACEQTVLLETGPGHATRCAETPYARIFEQEKRRLTRMGLAADEMRLALEDLNLGRLRVASKGLGRHPRFGTAPKAPKLVELSEGEQEAEGMYMIGQLAVLKDEVSTIPALHHDVSVESSKRLEALSEPTVSERSPGSGARASDVAIIGMACLLPKAGDVQTYWDNILNKVDAITEIPKDRWDWTLYYDPDVKAKDKIYSKWGGFIDDIPFDPMRYGMPPTSLRSIEPAQLLTLEVVRAALDDAGYSERSFPRERTAVILGAGGGAADLGLRYGARAFLPLLDTVPGLPITSKEILARLEDILPEWTEDSFAGILTNVIAGRVANRFDLGGPNYTVDAACASSLAAVSLALKELEEHSSDVVVVGGVDTMQNPFLYLCFSKTHALSPRGRCRAFDAGADGIAISEGIAVLVLKRLSDAERDGDRIYAIIKGAGSSSDGRDKGLTAPRPEGQARALERAYDKAQVSPATIGLVEAHGTGTVAGDHAEVQALARVFAHAHARRQRCALGSVKSMIGHTKCTAGIAGLLKVALALHHKVLPPTLGVETPNASAGFSESPFYLNTDARPWLPATEGHPRRAGVSAFGFGGTNFHVVVEEYVSDSGAAAPSGARNWPGELFVWAADSRASLLGAINRFDAALAAAATVPLRNLSYSVWKGQRQLVASSGVRLAIVAGSHDDLKQKLGVARDALQRPATPSIADPRGLYFSEQPLAPGGKVAFLFPGQGSQYPGMLRDLAVHFPEVRRCFERADRTLADVFPESLTSYVFPPPSFTADEEKARQQALTRTHVAQSAIGAADIAMFRLLESLGVRPDFAAGHSYGEYVALCAADVFSEEALLVLSEARGRFIAEAVGTHPGTMAAVDADAGAVEGVLDHVPGAVIANLNGPKQTVISGSEPAIDEAVEHLKARGLRARRLPVACAFHSPLVAPAQKRFAELLATLALGKARIPVYSNTTAGPYPSDRDGIAAQLVAHLVRPVDFVGEIEALYAAGARIFVEVGPRNVLTALTDQILRDRPRLAAASDQSGRSGLLQLQHLLGALAVHGVPVKLDALYDGRSVSELDLDHIAVEPGATALPSTTWLVNGTRAKPLKEVPKTVRTDAPRPLPPVGPSVSPGPTATPVANASPAATPALPMPFGAATGSVSSSNGTSADPVSQVMGQFQQMMTRFLDTQRSVMLAYLQGASALDGETIVSETPRWAAVRDAPSGPALAREAPVATSSASSASRGRPETPQLTSRERPDTPQLISRLLAIVSERTGYPVEMLNLDLDLEAELGIDSIKRVEILGNFQESFASMAIQDGDDMMEKLATVKTLRGIIDWVAERLSALPATATNGTSPEGLHASEADAQEGTSDGGSEERIQRYTLTTVRS